MNIPYFSSARKHIFEFLEGEAGKHFFLAGIIVLVGLSSYTLGVISAKEESRPKIEFIKENLPPLKNPGVESLPIVASQSGSLYYRQDCPGAGRIKPENRRFFQSENQAAAAGYKPSKSCFQNN